MPVMDRAMRVLLTGAGGFIGSHLVERLLADGHSVIAVDNFETGSRGNLRSVESDPRLTVLEHDATTPLPIEGPLDWVLHFASPASPPKYLARPVETLRVNGEGTFALLELAQRAGASFLLASTSEVYGDPQVHPQPEGYWGNVNPIGLRSVYDEGKRYAEALTLAYHRTHGLSVRIIRIFNTYGPRMDPEDGRVVTNFITQAMCGKPITVYGSGDQTRSFQYVDDLVEGITRFMSVEHTGPLNLGNPEEYTMLGLARLIRDLVGSSSPIAFAPLPEDDPKQRRPDISLARSLLDWEPRVSVRDGLTRTIEYFRSRSAHRSRSNGMPGPQSIDRLPMPGAMSTSG
jgi:dTDP-glucose 4,6-dehydratase